jgi:hypothetical protein
MFHAERGRGWVTLAFVTVFWSCVGASVAYARNHYWGYRKYFRNPGQSPPLSEHPGLFLPVAVLGFPAMFVGPVATVLAVLYSLRSNRTRSDLVRAAFAVLSAAAHCGSIPPERWTGTSTERPRRFTEHCAPPLRLCRRVERYRHRAREVRGA